MNLSLRSTLLLAFLAMAGMNAHAAIETRLNIAYHGETPAECADNIRCKLDLYLPEHADGCPVLVWFHGGGLTEGGKSGTAPLGRTFAEAGIAVAIPNYRLHPDVSFPTYVEDAAAAVAWVYQHASELGIDQERVYVGGHSAGGWLASMVVMDPRYLAAHQIDVAALAGAIPMSGQMLTHSTVRKERGLGSRIVVDDAAPLYYVRKDTPPILLLAADHDMAYRLTESQLFLETMQAAGNERIELRVVADRDHGTIASKAYIAGDPAGLLMQQFILQGRAGNPAVHQSAK